MIILGEKIRETRKRKKMSQKKLAEGICTQVTISKIENKNTVPRISNLAKICRRLEIKMEDVYVVETKSSDAYEKLKILENHYRNARYKRAYDYVHAEIDENSLIYTSDKKRYYYYLACTLIEVTKDTTDALYYLNLALSKSKKHFMDSMILNKIGQIYTMQNRLDKSQLYYNMAIDNLKMEKLPDDKYTKDTVLIYLETAKYYSKINDNKSAIKYTNEGIKISEINGEYFYLDDLYFEKAKCFGFFNKRKEAIENYLIAFGLAKINKNDLIVETVIKKLKEYQLSLG